MYLPTFLVSGGLPTVTTINKNEKLESMELFWSWLEFPASQGVVFPVILANNPSPPTSPMYYRYTGGHTIPYNNVP